MVLTDETKKRFLGDENVLSVHDQTKRFELIEQLLEGLYSQVDAGGLSFLTLSPASCLIQH